MKEIQFSINKQKVKSWRCFALILGHVDLLTELCSVKQANIADHLHE
jgi:hypothetical protein